MLMKYDERKVQFPLKNDLMFGLVMQDCELCKNLIERILPGKKISRLRICEASNTELQKTIYTGILSKSVRLDVLFEGDDMWYDIEMQTVEDSCLPLRGRYYGSAMDIDEIRQGTPYSKLKHSYVIFICTFDHYKLDQAVYTFENFDCKNNLSYGDNSFKIVVNTKSSKKNTPPELIPFFDYINDMEVPEDDAFIQALHAQVEGFNTSEWRRRLMTLEEKMRLEREKAFAEGEARGKTAAITETAKNMKAKGFDSKDIADITGLSTEEIAKL